MMTAICNSVHKMNHLLAACVNGEAHSMSCHNHLRNVWVKNVLDSLTKLLRKHLNDSLDGIAPELCVSLGFTSLARASNKILVSAETISRVLEKFFDSGQRRIILGSYCSMLRGRVQMGGRILHQWPPWQFFGTKTTVLSSLMI